MKKKLIVLSGLVLSFSPVLALAQGIGFGGTSSNACNYGRVTGNLFGFICRIGEFLNAVVPVLIALAVVYFVWGVISYVISDDEEAKAKGKDRIIYGIIGLAVIIGLWGLVNLVRNTLDLNNTQNVNLPTVPVVIPGSGNITPGGGGSNYNN
jgi:hypothetical protein